MELTVSIKIDAHTPAPQLRAFQELLGYAINANPVSGNGASVDKPTAKPTPAQDEAEWNAAAPATPQAAMPAAAAPSGPVMPQEVAKQQSAATAEPAKRPPGARGRPAMSPEQRAAKEAAKKAEKEIKTAPVAADPPKPAPEHKAPSAPAQAEPAQYAPVISAVPGMPASFAAPTQVAVLSADQQSLYAQAQSMIDQLNGIQPGTAYSMLRGVLPGTPIFRVQNLPFEHLEGFMLKLHTAIEAAQAALARTSVQQSQQPAAA